MRDDFELEVEGHRIRITNPDKPLWPEIQVTKTDYIKYLIEMAPYLLPYAKNRLLTTIRFPHGIHEESFYQKNLPTYAPSWIASHVWKETRYILANDIATLVWLANQACLEFHVPFHLYDQSYPTELAFDLDPSDLDNFDLVLEVSLRIKEVLDSLGLLSRAKTSGASGLQIYIPIEPHYTYPQTHQLNKFIAQYIAEKYPQLVTIERLVKNRGSKLYFDYLQHGEGRTLPATYSVRARQEGTVSAPVSWEEISSGFSPTHFTIKNIKQRVNQIGDLFDMMTDQHSRQSIDQLLLFINR